MMLLGFRRARIGWLALLIIGVALASMMNRGAMLIIIIPLAVAVISTGKWRELFFAFAVAAGLVGGAYALGATIPTTSSRDISAEQLVDNFTSIFGDFRPRTVMSLKERKIGVWLGGTRSSTTTFTDLTFGQAKALGST